MAKTPEGAVKEKGRRIFSEAGCFHFPVQQGATSRGGIPDDVVCLGGIFLLVEYKAHMRWDKRNEAAFRTLPTLKQIRVMEEARKAGAATWVIDDTTINMLADFLMTCNSGDLDRRIYIARNNARFAWKWTLEAMLAYRAGKGILTWVGSPGIPVFI